jgi:hypothetical protein
MLLRNNLLFVYLFVFLAVFCLRAEATTYYVDAENGNDSWTGQIAIAAGKDGPWRSLAKVSGTNLIPGDTVLLNCNQTWNETLKINQSGTIDASIKIGPYDASCANPPTISGLWQIPDFAWEPHANGIWKVQLPLTLIKNGQLSNGKLNWMVWSANNDAKINPGVDTCAPGKTAPCLNIKGGSTTSVLSSTPFAIEKGVSYQVGFSSLISANQAVATQLVPNGDLKSGISNWTTWSSTNDLSIQPSTSTCQAGQTPPCLSVVSKASSGLLISSSFPINQGETYTLTFSASVPSDKTIGAVMRQSYSPYKTLGLGKYDITGSGSWANYSYTFVATATESAARLDFAIPDGSTIQIQNVSLKSPNITNAQAIQAVVRQDGPSSYQKLGLDVLANNQNAQWKDSTYTFVATNTIPNARLDFEISSNSTAQLQHIYISKAESSATVSQLLENNIPQGIAHHPNKGFDSAAPDSVFFRTAASSPTVLDANGIKGSNYLTTGSDFFLPAGGSIDVGTPVTIRDQGWDISQVAVSAISGTKINVTPNTTYPLYWKGLGYFFTNKLWMVDSASEWYFDAVSQVLYYYPNSATPTSIALVSDLTGASLKSQSNISIDSINFNGLSTGIDATKAVNISLNNLYISNIKAQGVQGQSSNSLTVQNSDFAHIGQDGISAWDATKANISNNTFDQIGVIMDMASNIASLPLKAYAAIVPGSNATVSQNKVSNFAYIGIWPQSNTNIVNNYINNGCLVLNDCGGIYLYALSTGSKVTGNLVDKLIGNVNGLPVPPFSIHTAGIYSDIGANNIVMEANTVTNTNFGIQLHDAYNHTINNNLLYGNKSIELWIQESSKPTAASTGYVQNVATSGNSIFPILTNNAVRLESSINKVNNFGSLNSDMFSTYYIPLVATEYNLGANASYTLPKWQAAAYNGTMRNLESNGKISAPLSNYAVGLAGTNLVPNSSFQNGIVGWYAYAKTTGPTRTLTKCTPEQTQVDCIKVNAATTDVGNFSSTTFNIKKGYYYLLSFDALTSDATQTVTAVVNKAGPTYYTSLMVAPLTGIQNTSGWKRYSMIFQAVDNALTDGSTAGVSGARIDFTGINAGQSISIADVELVPIGLTAPTKSSRIISNPTFAQKAVACPSSDQILCDSYIGFPDNTKVTWPVTLPALGSKVMFSQNMDYLDSDEDGIPNSQDVCANTVLSAAINSKGCAIGQ